MCQKGIKTPNTAVFNTNTQSNLPLAAQRALAEAAARKQNAAGKTEKKTVKELGGRKEGKEPTRFGDWEFKGRAIDF